MRYDKQKALESIKDVFYMPTNKPIIVPNERDERSTLFNIDAGGSRNTNHNLNNSFLPVPPSREREDPKSWRNAIMEAERSVLPFRCKMQEIFRDTALNPHVAACVTKRKNLTLLRKFALTDKEGNINEEWTEYLDKSWFRSFLSYAIDSIFYGYSLISLGDIVENELINLTIVRRDNISPERKHVTAAPYLPTGLSWEEEPYNEWHIWIPTPTVDGTTSCGLGLFYSVALIEIFIRNMNSDNANFLELFGNPYRALYLDTTINNETERAAAEAALRNQGALGYGIFNKEDKLELLSGTSNNGWRAYGETGIRWEKEISKVLLGHEDAMSSTPGKLGGGQSQGGDHSPIKDSLLEIQTSDENFITPIINHELITRLRYHGIEIPEDLTFKFLNNEEEEQIAKSKGELNLQYSQIARNLAGSGLTIDPKWWEEHTGIGLSNPEVVNEKEPDIVINPYGDK